MRAAEIPAAHLAEVARAFNARYDVKPSGCWEWRNVRSKTGYGTFSAPVVGILLAHRASWMIAYGAIPEGKYICHHCDNPPCVNPDHLFVGSPRDNTADMHAKGRSRNPSGSSHWNAKLATRDVSEIRRRYVPRTLSGSGTGASSAELAAEFGVSPEQIVKIANGKKWKGAA